MTNQVREKTLSRPYSRSSTISPFLVRTPGLTEIRVNEENTHYLVSAQLPLLRKEDIHITVEGNVVTLATQKNRMPKYSGVESVQDIKCTDEDIKIIHTFSLDSAIDLVKAHATYKDGLLELMLPKHTFTSKRLLVN